MTGSPAPPDGATRAVHVLVSGLVQGVGFRWHAVEQARACGVDGWVRNLEDGRVEAWLQGPRAAVDDVIGWMHRGPRRARVEALHARDVEADPALRGFHERR